jgi:hypothetical protein
MCSTLSEVTPAASRDLAEERLGEGGGGDFKSLCTHPRQGEVGSWEGGVITVSHVGRGRGALSYKNISKSKKLVILLVLHRKGYENLDFVNIHVYFCISLEKRTARPN